MGPPGCPPPPASFYLLAAATLSTTVSTKKARNREKRLSAPTRFLFAPRRYPALLEESVAPTASWISWIPFAGSAAGKESSSVRRSSLLTSPTTELDTAARVCQIRTVSGRYLGTGYEWRDGYVVTAAHLFDDESGITRDGVVLRFVSDSPLFGDRLFEDVPASLRGASSQADVAVLQIFAKNSEDGGKKTTTAPTDKHTSNVPPGLGTPIFCVGTPHHARSPVLVRGHVAQPRQEFSLVATLPSQPGGGQGREGQP